MAALQRIRNHSVALLIIVGLAMAAFIIGDLLTSSSSIMNSNRDKVVTVNGKKVTSEEFSLLQKRKEEFLKTMIGRDVNSEMSHQVTQQVYNDYVSTRLMDQVNDDLGLTVTDDELVDLLSGDHTSTLMQQLFGQQAKQIAAFFKEREENDDYDEVAQQYPFATHDNWMEIESQVRLYRQIEKFGNLVSAAVKPNRLEAKDNFAGDNEQVSFNYVRQQAYAVADSLVNVSEADIQAYYNATKRRYKQDESRTVKYIAVPLRPSQQDFNEALEELQSVRDEFATADDVSDLVTSNSAVPYVDAFVPVSDFSGELLEFVQNGAKDALYEPTRQDDGYLMARIIDKTTAPDSLEVELAIFNTREKFDSVVAALKAPHADFAEAVKASDNPQLVQQEGKLGWITEISGLQMLNSELRDKVFATPVGKQFTHEQNAGLGTIWYVGRVTDATKPVEKAKVAVYAIDVAPSSRTRREEYGKLNNFLTEHKTVEQMQDSAASAGYHMLTAVVRNDSYNIGNVTDARQAVRFAFQEDKGSVSEIYECGDNLLVVVPTEKNAKGYRSLKDADLKEGIRRQLRPEKKVAYIIEHKLANVTDKTLEGYAAALDTPIDSASFVNFNLRSISGLGNEPTVVAAALAAKPGELVGPLAGKNSAVVLQVTKRESKDLEYDEEARLQTLAASPEYTSANPVSVLQDKADIEDNRITFY